MKLTILVTRIQKNVAKTLETYVIWRPQGPGLLREDASLGLGFSKEGFDAISFSPPELPW